jgi:phage-related protein
VEQIRPWAVEFYRDERGRSPVREFIDGLERTLRAKTLRNIALLEEMGDRLGMPLARPVAGQAFWELRVQAGGNIVRVFYFAISGRRMVLLHGLEKKDRKTPRRELDIAVRRQQEVLRRLV